MHGTFLIYSESAKPANFVKGFVDYNFYCSQVQCIIDPSNLSSNHAFNLKYKFTTVYYLSVESLIYSIVGLTYMTLDTYCLYFVFLRINYCLITFCVS